MSQNNIVCYEGIQRIFRNSIVTLLRKTLTEKFPDDFMDKLKSPFPKEEWETIKFHASLSRTSGDLSSQIVDDFDLLSVNHFFNIFDKHYDIFFQNEIDKEKLEKVEKNRRKNKLLNWFKTIKDLRDPLSHPAEEDFSREDSFMVLDCARRVLSRLDLLNEAENIQKLMEGLFISSQATGQITGKVQREPLEDQLPPRESVVIDFIGREKELRQLWDWFDDPVSRRWALAGEGGKGKSALAYDFAFQVKIKSPQPYQTVLWLSAKRRQFLEGKTTDINEPDFSDLDSALSKLLTHFGWIEEIKNPLETKRKNVLELLDKFPALLIIDDVDSITRENEEVTEFLSFQVPQTKSKTLFTSRRTLFGMGGSTIHVEGFSKEDAKQFIVSRCNLMNLDNAIFTEQVMADIIRITEGSPLYIEDLMRLVSVIPIKEAMRQWEDKGGNDARRYALESECDHLETEAARKVLMVASICKNAISFVELEAITGYSSKIITESLNELQRIFLVPKPRVIEGEERFEVNVNTKMLVREVYGRSDKYRKLEEACRIVNEGYKTSGNVDINAILRQVSFLNKDFKFQESEQLLLNALEKYHSNPEIICALAELYCSWKPTRTTDARGYFHRASQLKFSNLNMYEKWVDMEFDKKEWTKIIEATEKGLKIFPKSKLLLYLAAKARIEIGRELSGRLIHSKAMKEFAEAKQLLKSSLESNSTFCEKEEKLNPEIYKELINVCQFSDDKSGIDYYLWRWRSENPDNSEADKLWKKFNK
jgi:tetratricopeptide (TPR) repeat protein